MNASTSQGQERKGPRRPKARLQGAKACLGPGCDHSGGFADVVNLPLARGKRHVTASKALWSIDSESWLNWGAGELFWKRLELVPAQGACPDVWRQLRFGSCARAGKRSGSEVINTQVDIY